MEKERSIFISGTNSISEEYKFKTNTDYKLLFRLNLPDKDTENWVLEYFLQSQKDQSLLYPLEKVWQKKGIPQEAFLAAVREIAIGSKFSKYAKINPAGIEIINKEKAYEFLKNDAFQLQQAGFIVQVPKDFSIGNSENSLNKIKIKLKLKDWSKFVNGNSLGDGLLDFDYKISMEDSELSIEEFKKIAENKEHLVCIKNKWVEINAEYLEKISRILENKNGNNFNEILNTVLSAANEGINILVEHNGKNYDSIIHAISENEKIIQLKAPKNFNGILREYQERGITWLNFTNKIGFGALLADDMGLGKTIQIIAHCLHNIEKDIFPILIICPTSVIGNWASEFSKFAPSIKVKIHHGSQRSSDEIFKKEANENHVILTSYALSRLDREEIFSINWGLTVLDEAQNIKNPIAKQTEIVKKIKTKYKIALTGTPIENRLADLWSIMQFLNPNYLPHWEKFQEMFARPIEIDMDRKKSEALKSVLAPFILRRLKTDKNILPELPEKTEKIQWCYLTEEQATLYKAAADASIKKIEEEDENKRRIMIFAAITKLKQICNHPANLLADSRLLGERSGKVKRLRELLEMNIQNSESCLIFSQYTEMGSILYENLKKEFNVPIFFFHGSLSRKNRDIIIKEFQKESESSESSLTKSSSPKIMILSLKAGGIGINLTNASQVIHFDRWWNPAVENQATDRAHRIGQKRKVFVHKFVTKGTIEEKIELILQKKKKLSDSLLSSEEQAFAKMNIDDLKELFKLSEYNLHNN